MEKRLRNLGYETAVEFLPLLPRIMIPPAIHARDARSCFSLQLLLVCYLTLNDHASLHPRSTGNTAQ